VRWAVISKIKGGPSARFDISQCEGVSCEAPESHVGLPYTISLQSDAQYRIILQPSPPLAGFAIKRANVLLIGPNIRCLGPYPSRGTLTAKPVMSGCSLFLCYDSLAAPNLDVYIHNSGSLFSLYCSCKLQSYVACKQQQFPH
jgi:hypothetical protein